MKILLLGPFSLSLFHTPWPQRPRLVPGRTASALSPPSRPTLCVLDLRLAAGVTPNSRHCRTPAPYQQNPNKKTEASGDQRTTRNPMPHTRSLRKLTIPRVDEVVNSLGNGGLSSLSDLVSSFNQIAVDQGTIPLPAFCRPTRMFKLARRATG